MAQARRRRPDRDVRPRARAGRHLGCARAPECAAKWLRASGHAQLPNDVAADRVGAEDVGRASCSDYVRTRLCDTPEMCQNLPVMNVKY